MPSIVAASEFGGKPLRCFPPVFLQTVAAHSLCVASLTHNSHGERSEKYFLAGTRPAQRKKERIVLEVMVQPIEFDRDYSEPEINALIRQFHDDHCTIRRDMISEGLLTRSGGVYRRVRPE